MTAVPVNFCAFLLADAAIARKVGQRVHKDKVPQKATPKKEPYIWFRKRSVAGVETLDSAAGQAPRFYDFDVECVAYDDREMDDLTELVRTRCNCYRGTFGDSTAQGCFVRDQDDNYEPYNVGGNNGAHVGVLDVQVIV